MNFFFALAIGLFLYGAGVVAHGGLGPLSALLLALGVVMATIGNGQRQKENREKKIEDNLRAFPHLSSLP